MRRLYVGWRVGLIALVLAVALAGLLERPVAEARALADRVTASHHSTPGARPEDLAPSYEDVFFQSRVDHLTLRGWLFHPANPSGRSVVVIHGSNADRADWAPLGRDLVAVGENVLLFDLRACGQSQGDHQTFGNLEQRDVLGAYDFMVARGYAPRSMGFLGESSGAVALLRASAQMPEVAGIVSDSSFLSSGAQFGAFWRSAGVAGPVVWLATEFTRLDGADPGAQVSDSVRAMPHRAILFIHAKGDPRIPVADARALRAASRSPSSELWITAAKSHDGSYSLDPRTYVARVVGFIDAQIAAPEAR